jgi:hypothetical protein
MNSGPIPYTTISCFTHTLRIHGCGHIVMQLLMPRMWCGVEVYTQAVCCVNTTPPT